MIALLNTQNEEIKHDTLYKTSLLLCTCVTIKTFRIACFLCISEKEASTYDGNLVTNGVKIYWNISPTAFTGNLCKYNLQCSFHKTVSENIFKDSEKTLMCNIHCLKRCINCKTLSNIQRRKLNGTVMDIKDSMHKSFAHFLIPECLTMQPRQYPIWVFLLTD